MTDIRQATAAEILAALHRGSGSVTAFLEHLADEPIDADVLSQSAGPAGNDNLLGLVPAAELMRRTVLLTGRITGRPFVYAESAIAVGRLPDPVRQRLEGSRDPIGRVLTEHRLAVRREPFGGPVVPSVTTVRIADLLEGAALSRRYRITLGNDPAIVVSEWFLQTVPEALGSLAPPPADPSGPSKL